MGYGETDPEAKVLLSEFNQGLAELGWRSGRNLRMDIRWAPGNVDQMPSLAKELVGLQPEVILANSTPVTLALQRETQTIPIVFTIVSDPVGSGIVASLPHPGRNITGFSHTEASLASKWLELLMGIVPGLKRAAMGCPIISSKSTAHRLYRWRRKTNYLPSIRPLLTPEMVACSHTEQISATYFAAPHRMWTVSSVAKSHQSFPFRCRPNLFWSST
jgi:ABC transporter substrate binding protein